MGMSSLCGPMSDGHRVRRLAVGDCVPNALAGFVRHQVVRNCWRLSEGQWRLEAIEFTEDWDDHQLAEIASEWRYLIDRGGVVFAVESDHRVIGFAAVDSTPLGSTGQYRQLTQVHVSEESRNRGVGKALFAASKLAAIELGAKALYISAHSSEETQAAYRALGCIDAVELVPELVAAEPFDVQLEYRLDGE